VAEALSDALVGYLTLQARARMYEVYSEHLLYDVIARVAHGRHWHMECEVPLRRWRGIRTGDFPRIDFVLRKNRTARSAVLLEVKYSATPFGKTVDVSTDVKKLRTALRRYGTTSTALLLVAGARQRDAGEVLPFAMKNLPAFSTEKALYDVSFPARHTCFGATVWRIPRSG